MKPFYLLGAIMVFLTGCASQQPETVSQDMVCGNSEFEHLFVIRQDHRYAYIGASVRDTYTQKHYFVKGKNIGKIELREGEQMVFDNNLTTWSQEGDSIVGPIRVYRLWQGMSEVYGTFSSLYDGENYLYRWIMKKEEQE